MYFATLATNNSLSAIVKLASYNSYLSYKNCAKTILKTHQDDVGSDCFSESPLVSGGEQLSDLSLCLFHGPDSGQPLLCGPQSSGNI